MPGGGVVAVLLLAAFALAFAASLRGTKVAGGPGRRRALLALRGLGLALAWLVATQPAWSHERTQRTRGRLAVLVDVSRSMGVGRDEASRFARVKRLVERWGEEPMAARALWLSFGSDVRPVAYRDLLENVRPEGEETRLLDAVKTLVGEDASEELGAVVVVSDGGDTTTRAVSGLELGGVRVHAVAVADERTDRDDAIVQVRVDHRAFLRQPYRIRATVRAPTSIGEPIPVALFRGDERIATKDAVIGEDGEAEVVFEVLPDRLGRVFHRLEIPTVREDVVPENNVRSVLVRVVRDRLRVLLVAGQPSWDVRFMRAFLKRDPSNDLVSFFILRTNTDMTMADPSEMALIPFPTDELFREHLSSFDLVIFQNFNYRPYRMGEYLPGLRRYVLEGGSFAMIGGDVSFASGDYAGTPVADVLPVELPSGPGPDALSLETFRPELVDATERHPIVALAPTPSASRALFAELAPCIGSNVVLGATASARTLLAHPTMRGRDGAPMPVLSVAEPGRGRVLALTVDSSWRWGMVTGGASGDASAYERFWDRALRWLARDPALEPAQISTDRERYGLGATVRVEVLGRDPAYVPLAGEHLALDMIDENDERVGSAEVVLDGDGRGRATLAGPARPGVHRIVARRGADGPALADEAFVVEASGSELADPRPDPRFLEQLAAATRGTFVPSVDEAPRLSEFDTTRERSLGVVREAPFQSPIAFVVLVALLVAEWIVRRRAGLR